jgi:hypothetical protein
VRIAYDAPSEPLNRQISLLPASSRVALMLTRARGGGRWRTRREGALEWFPEMLGMTMVVGGQEETGSLGTMRRSSREEESGWIVMSSPHRCFVSPLLRATTPLQPLLRAASTHQCFVLLRCSTVSSRRGSLRPDPHRSTGAAGSSL